MNRFKRYIITAMTLLATCANVTISNADYDYDYNYDYESEYDSSYSTYYYDYYIKNMDVNVEVNDKREYKVTETIDVYFNEHRHGIIRKIPKSSSLEEYKIKDVAVNGADYTISDGANYEIKIGSPYEEVIGDKKYVIEYTLSHYKDSEKDGDYLYLNVLGTEWDTYIENFTSKVSYPENFKMVDTTVTSGSYGSTENNLASYTIEDGFVDIYSLGTISCNEGITINIRFEEGAFANAPTNIKGILINVLKVVSVVFMIIVAVVAISSRRKKKHEMSVVEFYPPEGLNSAELGYLYTNCVYDKTVLSLIYNWASEGYLKITLLELSAGGDFSLTKLKSMDKSKSEYERALFRKIFSYGETVTGDELKYELYSDTKKCKHDIKKKFKNDELYMKKDNKHMLICAISILLSLIATIIEYGPDILTVIFMLTPIIIFSKFVHKSNCDENKSVLKNIFGHENMFSIVFVAIAIMIIHITSTQDVSIQSLTTDYVVILICACLSMFIGKFIISSKSDYEKEVYSRIVGFKDFIEMVEKDKLEMLLEEDPDYFYKVLPYAHALNITDKWVEKFELLAIPPSSYYDYGHTRNGLYILNNKFERAGESMCTSEPSSSSGGFSSGGFSGGGSGGGGGSSW